MSTLFTLNNLEFKDIDTTVVYTSSYNYLNDAIFFLHHDTEVITITSNASITDIPISILKEFNCLYLLTQTKLTKIDELKLSILKSLSSTKTIYVFLNVLTYLEPSFKKNIINYLKLHHKRIINYTQNMEETLLLDYIIVVHNDLVIMEGAKKSVLLEEKIFKKLGLNLPFIVELSIGLKYYGLISKIYFDNESLVQALWN